MVVREEGALDTSLLAAPMPVTEHKRDAGLVRGIGTFGLGAGIVNGVVGAGIFALPSAMARDAGAWAPWAFAICAIAMAAVVICFAEAGSRVPTSGGPYGIVAEALGPGAGFVAGMMLWMSSVVACGGIAAALADSVGALLPSAGGSLVRAVIIVAAIAGIATVNLTGVRSGARLAASMTMVKVVPLMVFVVAGAIALLAAPVHAGALPLPHAYGHALILAVFAMCGMETVLGASGEVANPSRTLPRALFGAMLFVVALYVAIQIISQGLLGPALAGSATPLADAMGVFSKALRLLLLVGAAISMLGWIASDILGAPRILFAFARDNMLPAVFGRVHPRSRVPHVAILVHATLAAALALTGSFVPLATMSTLYTAALYILVCASAYTLRQQKIAMAGPPLAFRIVPVCAALGIASMAGLCLAADWFEIIGLLATIILGIAIYWLARGSPSSV